MKRRIFAILCAAALVASCAKTDSSLDGGDSYAVSIEPMIQTRATELSFESGDEIGLSITMDSDQSMFVENYQMTYNGSSFVSDLAWYADSDATSTLFAYYPYVTGESLPASFTIQADQTADNAYTASDLMFASKEGVTPTTSTLMTFKHVLSRVVADVDNQSGSDIVSIEISGTYPTATINTSELSVSVDNSSTPVDINAPLWDDGLYKAIIVPQEVALTFTITLANGTVTSRDKASVTFVAGKEYTAEILVTKDNIDVDLSGDAEDWTDGGLIPDADSDSSDDVSFEEFENYFVYDGETYNIVTLSDGSVWMADNLRYVPAGYTPSSDPADFNGLWYPYTLDYAQAETDGALAVNLDAKYVVVDTSDDAVKQYGYLYDVEAAFGKRINSADDFSDFEGAQGICPPGWHVPTKMEYFTLVGSSNGMTDNTNALFYETDDSIIGYSKDYAHIQKANDLGFNFQLTGYVTCATYSDATTPATGSHQKTVVWSGNCTKTDWFGEKALSYYLSSTPYQMLYDTTGDSSTPVKGAQMWSIMTTFSTSYYPVGRMALAYSYASGGQAVRCVKDGTVDITDFIQ